PRLSRLLLLHEAVLSIARPRRAGALRRRSVAASPGRFDQEHVALADGHADFLGLQDARRAPVRFEPVAMRQPVLAPEQAVRRVAHAVAGGVGDRRLVDVDAQPEHGADAAPMHAVAGGIGTELVPLEREREARLGALDAAELDPAGRLSLARGLPAVAGRAGAAARPRVEHVPDERLARARVHPLDPDPEPAPPPPPHPLPTPP